MKGKRWLWWGMMAALLGWWPGLAAGEMKLPFFGEAETWWVAQGWHECDGTHCGAQDKAWDFNWGNGSDDLGKPVVAPEDGRVVNLCAGSCGSGWGRYVVIDYGGGRYGLLAHFQKVFARKGQYVEQSQVIGTCGGSGGWSPHIHYQVNNGPNVNAQSIHSRFADPSTQAHGGIPRKGSYYASANSMLVTKAFFRHGHGRLGGYQNAIHWYYPYRRDQLYRWDHTPRNMYIQDYNGGSYGASAIVYDALGGAREAKVVRSGFFNTWARELGGPASSLGAPLGDEYPLGSNRARQDFQKAYLYTDGHRITVNPWPRVGPGWFDDQPHWNPALSYGFADSYNRLGANPVVGSPKNGVHRWGPVWIQDYDWGRYGWCAMILNPSMNEAYLTRTGFWERYKELGPAEVGYPYGEEYATGNGGARQNFQRGFMIWRPGANRAEWHRW